MLSEFRRTIASTIDWRHQRLISIESDLATVHGVVHDAVIVVCTCSVAISSGELTLPAFSDIRPVHADAVVTICALLFVRHTEDVAKLMDRHTHSITATGGKVEIVAAPSAALGLGPLSEQSVYEAATG